MWHKDERFMKIIRKEFELIKGVNNANKGIIGETEIAAPGEDKAGRKSIK